MTAPVPSAGDGHRITGRAWALGDSVNTDALYPGFAMRMPIPEAARYVLYDSHPGWADAVEPGDIVVAGRNFGVGSSRPVSLLLRHLGIAALVAEEFNSLFLRNAINNGLPALTVPGARSMVTEGRNVTVHLSEGWLSTDAGRIEAAPLPPLILGILDAGGLLARLVSQGHLPADAVR